MDTKLKADIAESAVITQLLKRGFRVLKPLGDRLPYDLAVDNNGELVKIQVKHAWYDNTKKLFIVDARRTKTNRRHMLRSYYTNHDFEFAVIYLAECEVFYIMPIAIFITYKSEVSFVEESKRQRKPRSAEFRNRWDLLEIIRQL